jgi:E3 ubiquitin-protein ligase MYCBP2
MKHKSLEREMKWSIDLFAEIEKKGLERLSALKLDKCEEIVQQSSRWYKNPAGYALYRFSYFLCHKCKKPYFGGEKVCEANNQEDFNPEELVCSGCSDFAALEDCPEHGKDFMYVAAYARA